MPLQSAAEDAQLRELIQQALKGNHEILMFQERIKGAKHRIKQAQSLSDPMLMFGYQNEGWNRYTYGEMQGAQWMFSLSQILPFPGKLELRGEIAEKDRDVVISTLDAVRLKTVARIKELYYDLFLAYKSIELINNNQSLLRRMEDAALSGFSTGSLMQEEVIALQREKYMAMEREYMLRLKIETTEAMINSLAGRDIGSAISKPKDLTPVGYPYSYEETVERTLRNSPDIKAKERAVQYAQAKARLAKREIYPDFTITGSVYPRSGPFEDMWSLTTSMNIPIFYRSKQRQMLYESESMVRETEHDLKSSRLMAASTVRETFSMRGAAQKIMELYKDALIPKSYQEYESALTFYKLGKARTNEVVEKIRRIIESETIYWSQFVEQEKAVARLLALTAEGPLVDIMATEEKDDASKK